MQVNWVWNSHLQADYLTCFSKSINGIGLPKLLLKPENEWI